MVENGHVRPGDLFLGADSHTCTYGCLAAFGSGIGSTDLAAILLTGKTWLKVPRTIKVEVLNALPDNVEAKDLALAIVGELGIAGATYQALEFHVQRIDLQAHDLGHVGAKLDVEAG